MCDILNKNAVNNTFTLDGIDVKIKYFYVTGTDNNKSYWRYWSAAEVPGSKQRCVISKGNIRGTSMAKHSISMGMDMVGSTCFWSGLSVIGPIYSRGYLNISGYPNFYGNVYSASKDKSCTKDFVYNPYSTSSILKDYKTGIKMFGNFNEYNHTTISAPQILDVYEEIFKYDYHQGVADVDPSEDVVHCWSKLRNQNIAGIKKLVIGVDTPDPFLGNQPANTKHRSIRFKFEGNRVKVTSLDETGYTLKNADSIIVFDKYYNLTKYNTFLVPKFNTRNVHIEVKGHIAKSATVVTQANDVLITDDIYYTGLNKNIPLKTDDYGTLNLNPTKLPVNTDGDKKKKDLQIYNALIDYIHNPANNINAKFGLIAGLGKMANGQNYEANIMTSYKLATGEYLANPVHKNRIDNKSTRNMLNDITIMMGAYFVPLIL